jgi:hypothetical protein
MRFLVTIGLIDTSHNIIGTDNDFKRKLSMLKSLKKYLIFDSKYDWSSFDEQINIAFQFIFHMSELSCLSATIKWSITDSDFAEKEDISL